MIMSRLICLILSALLVVSSNAQYIQDILNQEVFDHAQVSMSVVDISNDQTILDINGDVSLIPASSLKVLTTFSSLQVLGENYRYQTRLSYAGTLLSDGTLLGDIIIIGSGDPSLASPDEDVLSLEQLLEDMSRAISDAGITCITGSIKVDASLFETAGIHDTWPWDDLTNYYASGAYGFNIRENFYDIIFSRTSQPSDKTQIVSMNPEIGFVQFDNEAVSYTHLTLPTTPYV